MNPGIIQTLWTCYAVEPSAAGDVGELQGGGDIINHSGDEVAKVYHGQGMEELMKNENCEPEKFEAFHLRSAN